MFLENISTITGFLSLFIVIPHLSQNKRIWSIFLMHFSYTIFKLCRYWIPWRRSNMLEAFIKNNRKSEIEILGFTGAILLLMIIPFSLIMIYLSFYPEILIVI